MEGDRGKLKMPGNRAVRGNCRGGISDLDEDRVFIEMAQASGITLIPYKSGNAGKTTSYGTGELIRNALEAGYRKITVSIGGSATNDGGAGMLAALGVEFYSKDGERFIPLERRWKHRKIDCSGILSEMRNASFCVMCDVTNPLLGIQGATYVFGPQKGASDRDLEILERGMVHYAEKIEVLCGRKVSEIPGAGAKRGMGVAFFLALQCQTAVRNSDGIGDGGF